MTQEIESRVRNLISAELGVCATSLDARLQDDLCADSLGIVELRLALEDEFGVKITDEEFDKVATVRDVIELVKRKVAH